MTAYKIIRRGLNGYRRQIKSGLTLEQAQEHCRDPETSSQTCTRADRKRITARIGPWFDGYEQD